MTLHRMLDTDYGVDGDDVLRARLAGGESPDGLLGGEHPLHVAARRFRTTAVAILLDHGATIDAVNEHGKTAYAHAVRRGFDAVADLLRDRGADVSLNAADRLAVLMSQKKEAEAREWLARHPEIARTGNPEEDRLLADVAGRFATWPVELLLAAGADVNAPALDGGGPLHQAAWFGQPQNARFLLTYAPDLDAFCREHASSPLGWAVHGSRYSGGAESRQDVYVELVRMLLDAGGGLPVEPASRSRYVRRLLEDASAEVRPLLLADSRFA